MNAKEFLQLEKQVEQMVAFQSLMKGELAKEIKEAKETLATLGGAKKVAQDKKDLEEAKVLFEKYKVSIEESFDKKEQQLSERLAAINTQEQLVKAQKEAAMQKEAAASAVRQTVQKEQYEFEQYRQKEQEKLAATRAELQVKLDKFQSRVDAVAEREVSVEKKLAIIKGL